MRKVCEAKGASTWFGLRENPNFMFGQKFSYEKKKNNENQN